MKLGLQGLRSLWLIALLFLSILCCVNEDAISAVASWPLIAREMPWLTKLKLIFSLNGRSSNKFTVKVSTFYPYDHILAHIGFLYCHDVVLKI